MTTGRGPKRILVVEDEENISQTLRYNLTREGYEVSEAATGTATVVGGFAFILAAAAPARISGSLA